MRHLFDSFTFDFSSQIERIKSKIISSGYLSVSLKRELDSITGVSGFGDSLIYKSTEIVRLFEGCNSEWLDDILFEYFDGYYDLVFDWGLCASTKSYYTYDVVKGSLDSITDSNLSTEGKVILVMISIIDMLYENVSKHFIEYNQKRDKYLKNKRSHHWVMKPSKPNKDSFKLINDIHPSIVCSVIHRDSNHYWFDDEMNGGVTYSEYQSLLKKIPERLKHFKIKFGGYYPRIVSDISSSYTEGFYENRKLLMGKFSIKFINS